MEKYTEQKSKIKTVSLKTIYEWMFKFLDKMRIELKHINRNTIKHNILFRYFYDSIKLVLKEYNASYLNYVNGKSNRLIMMKERKKVFENFKKINKFLSAFTSILTSMCEEKKETSTLEDFKKSNDYRKLCSNEFGKGFQSFMNRVDDGIYENVVNSLSNKNNVKGVKELCKVYTESKKALKNDITKGSGVQLLASAVLNKKNKEKESKKVEERNKLDERRNKRTKEREERRNKRILIDYAEGVIPLINNHTAKLCEVLEKYKINCKESKYGEAINNMLKCWISKYSKGNLEKAVCSKEYCKSLFEELQGYGKLCGGDDNYNLSVLVTQWSGRICMLLNDCVKKKEKLDNNVDNLKSDGWYTSWKEFEFNKIVGVIKDEDEVFFLDNVKKLKDEIDLENKNFNRNFNEEKEKLTKAFMNVYSYVFGRLSVMT